MICSIAMSTYNGSRFLQKQLDSLAAQTRPADEIIISDDASGDDTYALLEGFQQAHPELHITLLKSEVNQGFRASFRRALAHCRGDLLFFCDQDDIWPKNKLETLIRYFELNPQMLSLISDFHTIDASDKPLCPDAQHENLWVSDRVMRSGDEPCKIALSEMLGRNQGQGCAMAIRRAVAEEYLAMDRAFTHDWICNLIAAMHGGLYFTREPLLFYRLHGSNVIGMAQGDHARRKTPLLRKPYEMALAFKYTFLEGEGNAARKNLYSVKSEIMDFVFERVKCSGKEQEELIAWRRHHAKRLDLIAQKNLFGYLGFFLTHPRFFREMAYFSTYEQYAIRFMSDLCAILK